MFDEARFLNYAGNVFIKILCSLMDDKIDEIEQFVGDDVYFDLSERSVSLSENDEKQIYGIPEIKNISLVAKYEANGLSIIEVNLTARYTDYIVNRNTNEIIDGDNKSREEHEYQLYFYKNLTTDKVSDSKICPKCDKKIDIIDNGKCSFCGNVYNLDDFNYFLNKVDQVS